MNPCKFNDRHVGLPLRFWISNQNLCTFTRDMVARPAYVFQRNKLLEPFLQTGSLPQLWFTPARADNQQFAVHAVHDIHILYFLFRNCSSFDVPVRPVASAFNICGLSNTSTLYSALTVFPFILSLSILPSTHTSHHEYRHSCTRLSRSH